MPIRPECRDLYPADWREISQRIRFVRAVGRCECTGHCKADHGGRCDARSRELTTRNTRIVLTVAHLDHDPRNCEESNLLAMCQACHLRYDHKLHMRNAAATRDRKRGQARLPLGTDR